MRSTSQSQRNWTDQRCRLPVLLLIVTLVVSACSSPPEPEPEPELPTTSTSVPQPVGGELTVEHFNPGDGVYCDGTARPAVLIVDATPGEVLTFTSPMPVEIDDGFADDQGRYQLTWTCGAEEAALTWEITAVGSTSGRTATFLVDGSHFNPDVEEVLEYAAASEPLICDGTQQVVGRLTNAAPNEIVVFTESGVDPVRDGTADGLGELDVNWTCRPDDGESSWALQAVGESSGRQVAFTISGQVPAPSTAGPIAVEEGAGPLICDRERRLVATLRNLTPLVRVRFEASPSTGPIREGQADSDGTLDVYWQCHRREGGTTWDLIAVEQTADGRTATLSFTGAASDATVTIDVGEDPFVCDGNTRQFAVLSGFVPREFVDFSSAQAQGIRQGQASADGHLPIRWQCGIDQADTVWEVTATGATSGLSVDFTITGIAP